jgi:cellulose 1,4-beta-cellobiosidase
LEFNTIEMRCKDINAESQLLGYAQCTPAAVITTQSVTTTLITSTTSKPSTNSVTSSKTSSGTATSTSATTTASASGNPYAGYQLYKNAEYSSEVYASAIPSLTGTLLAAASAAAEVPSFLWL